LKQLAADIEREQGRIKPDPIPKTHNEKVAIVGAGPAGLSAAYELAKLGYPITVFERMPEPGGMMRYGIPDHRLKKYVVANEIAYIQDLGVEIKAGVEFGKDLQLDTLRNEGYKAIFIANGLQLSRKLRIPSEDLEGVFHALDLLRQVNLGERPKLGERVVVIGGGNVAIDVARTALRLGAEAVELACLESREEMPALEWEIQGAVIEGVVLNVSWGPKEILGDGKKATGVKFVRCASVFDENGKFSPSFDETVTKVLEGDTVIVAIGQMSETSCLPPILLDERGRAISADSLTLETNIPGVFAGGDIVTGPQNIIEALGAGKRAAVSIARYLNGQDLRAGREEEIEEANWVKDWEKITKKPERYTAPHTDIGKQKVSFEEADELLAKIKEVATFEARRCLECGPCNECLESEKLCEADKAVVNETLCIGCNFCVVVCPFSAIEKNEMGVAQVDEYLCKGCGNCATECPTGAITMQRLTNSQIVTQVLSAFGGGST
jgi:NADPH-dependent glutamate synthase beta subunit-like oxidoreductase/Pyruvate/2-oxoacid:ferredoxin oxidoreductase delta subunit